ncbi:cysteine--tRNA ligase [Candidatus Wolfebacteria bacterium]|nr:cysteine--tRNA ligase [Candidatus Wolfebacteria bacterium]
MKIFDTLSGKKIELKKSKKALKLFVCGPTVYDYSHIGHARTYAVFDAFVKYLRSIGFKIYYLQNITDIDDKIINRAREKKTTPASIARKFEKEYLSDMKKLKITSINKYARATEHVKEIQKQISTLIAKGFAYRTKNGVYFEIKKFNDYGGLSKQNLENLRAGWRIEPDSQKKDALDFALWKLTNEKPNWPSPWGVGRPGWHIEDTAITEKYFGPQYDIHGGGTDLKFPHHESEIAQQEAASGKKPLAKIWMHTGFLLVNGEKMSKSLNNYITINDFLKKHSSEVLRMMIFLNHYRSPFNYTEQLAEQSENALKTLENFLAKLNFVSSAKNKSKIKFNSSKILSDFEKNFYAAMNDDFNTPKGLASVFNLIANIQNNIWNIPKKDAKSIIKSLKQILKIFGIGVKTAKIPAKIKSLAKKREQFRAYRQFTQADALRSKIKMLGYEIEDTPLGQIITKTNK